MRKIYDTIVYWYGRIVVNGLDWLILWLMEVFAT